MPKRICIFMLLCSLCFSSGCQKISSFFSEQTEETNIEKPQETETAWLYTPSTRTIEDTLTEYTVPLEFVVSDISITETLPIAKNLKKGLESPLNTWIEELSTNLGNHIISEFDFTPMLEQTNLYTPVEKYIAISGELSFLGPYASVKIVGIPGIRNMDTKEPIVLETEEIQFQVTKFYHVPEQKEVGISALFSNQETYLSVLETILQQKINYEQKDAFDILRKPFTNMTENDFYLYYTSGVSTKTEPCFFITLHEDNAYCSNPTEFQIDLFQLQPYLSFAPNDVKEIAEIPNLLTKKFLDTTSAITVEEDTSITIDGCENSFFIKIGYFQEEELTDRINEQLSVAQRNYAKNNPIATYFSPENNASLRVMSYRCIGPFLKVFLVSSAEVNGTYMFHQTNIVIYLPTGEQLTVQDLLLPEYIDKLTEDQLYYLSTTDFSLDATGTITVPLWTVKEDGTMNLTYESKLFDFEKYTDF